MKRRGRNRIGEGKARIPPIDLAHGEFNASERATLTKLAKGPELKKRRDCIEYLECGLEVRRNLRFIVSLCDRLLIPDRSHHVRWQSLLMLGRIAQTRPEMVWPLVEKWGLSKNRDIRTGVAVCILEHVLEDRFEEFFPRVRSIIESGGRRFVYTLKACYKLGQAEREPNSKAWDELLSRYQNKGWRRAPTSQ